MSDGFLDANAGDQRQAVVDALLDGPDIDQVVRLSIAHASDGTGLVVGARVQMVETIPVHVLSHALADARRRVEGVAGANAEVFIDPELVPDPNRTEPATDVIVIKASD